MQLPFAIIDLMYMQMWLILIYSLKRMQSGKWETLSEGIIIVKNARVLSEEERRSIRNGGILIEAYYIDRIFYPSRSLNRG
jgi:hypothetical protein